MPRVARVAARIGLVVLLLSVAAGIAGGIAYALVDPVSVGPVPGPEACPQPPCFDADLPSGWDLVTALPVMGYVASVLLGVPCAVLALTWFLRRRRTQAATAAPWFAGPLIVVVGYELVPHIVNPCWVADASAVCEAADVSGRLHGLHHTLFGSLPLTLLYLRLLRRRAVDRGELA